MTDRRVTRRRFVTGFYAAALAASLSGAARADGSGLLDFPTTEKELASSREFYEVSRQEVRPSRLPDAVTRAARRAVPGLNILEAHRIRHRPITWWPVHTEFTLKGRDAAGREVSVRTSENGGQPVIARIVPAREIPDAVLAEARPFAAEHGYTLTGALVATRDERFLGRTVAHTAYYLKGTHPDRPKVERYLWHSFQGKFRLADLDDLLLRLMGVN